MGAFLCSPIVSGANRIRGNQGTAEPNVIKQRTLKNVIRALRRSLRAALVGIGGVGTSGANTFSPGTACTTTRRSFCSQRATVAVLTLSPRVGTRMSVAMALL